MTNFFIDFFFNIEKETAFLAKKAKEIQSEECSVRALIIFMELRESKKVKNLQKRQKRLGTEKKKKLQKKLLFFSTPKIDYRKTIEGNIEDKVFLPTLENGSKSCRWLLSHKEELCGAYHEGIEYKGKPISKWDPIALHAESILRFIR